MTARRIRRALGLFLLAVACGRSSFALPPSLLVQVVDEADHPVASADVELRTGDPEHGRSIGQSRTDDRGVAIFAHPGPGTYVLHAGTDLRCCIREGSIETTLGSETELVMIETATGPCPTWTPPSCD